MGGFVSCFIQPPRKSMLRSFWLSVLKLTPHSRRDRCLFQAILSSPYLVYTSLAPHRNQRIFYAFDIKYGVSIALPYFDGPGGNSAIAAMGGRLYVIGGLRRASPFQEAMAFDPTTHEWVDAGITHRLRSKALAVAFNGTICIFGGCNDSAESWAEAYDRDARTWNPMRLPASLGQMVGALFSQPLTAAIETSHSQKIFLQGPDRGIILDFAQNRWGEFPPALRARWRTHSTAAVVHNIIFTCRSQNAGVGAGAGAGAAGEIVSVGAYYPLRNVWLTLQGLEKNYHENADIFDFLSVDGKLVIYQKFHIVTICDKPYIYRRNKHNAPVRFLVFDVTPNFLDNRVTVEFLWEFHVPDLNGDLVLSVPAYS